MISKLFAGNGFYIGLMFEQAAARHPLTEVILDRPLGIATGRGTSFTVAELAECVDDLAARLRAAGVRGGDRVAIYKSHDFDIVLLACAVSRVGAVPALLSPALDGSTALELLRRLDRPWLLTDGSTLAEELPTLADEVTGIILTAGSSERSCQALADYAGAPRRPPLVLHPRQPTMITHSSGTTGVPKLVVHGAGALWHRLQPQRLWSWPMRSEETVAFCLTFAHSRFYHALAVFLGYGNRLVIAADHAPGHIGPLFARTKPGFVETHPNTFIDWEVLADAPGGPLSNVRYFSGTFDAMHPRTIARMLGASRRRAPVFLQFYGQSETGPVSGRWYTRRSAATANGRCVGLPLPGFVRLRVVGQGGRRLPPGQTGFLEVKNRARALTYLGEEERYRDQLSQGWWRLGDMGYRDRLGLLYLLDREVDRIDAMDSNLAAEDLLMSRLPELREVVVVAGASGEAVPVICTHDDQPLDRGRWTRAVADLPELETPVKFRFEDLPRTSTWKIRRPELVRMLRESRDGNHG